MPAHFHAAGKGEAVEKSLWLVNGLALFITVSATSAAAQTDASVVVVVHDSAGVPPEALEAARGNAARVFANAGVSVHWHANAGIGTACRPDASAEADERFCVQVLLRPRNRESAPGQRRIMGMALAASQQRAVLSLYFDAVTDVAKQYGASVGQVLGIALAHEMGHVLLPPPSHSATGIMQASWEGDDLRHAIMGEAAFTADQATAMHARLRARMDRR